MKRAHQEVVALQAGNEENLALWKCLCDVSREMFKEVYGRLDVTLEVVIISCFYHSLQFCSHKN